jgi:hypothetical protein
LSQPHPIHRDGGWTVAQVVSHINVCTLMWLGDLQRLRDDPELTFFFREEIGHDLTGYPPPTAEIAARQIASTRRTLAHSLPNTAEALLDRTVEIPDLGTMTIAEWTPLITGHLAGHVDQALDIMRDREVLPEDARSRPRACACSAPRRPARSSRSPGSVTPRAPML